MVPFQRETFPWASRSNLLEVNALSKFKCQNHWEWWCFAEFPLKKQRKQKVWWWWWRWRCNLGWRWRRKDENTRVCFCDFLGYLWKVLLQLGWSIATKQHWWTNCCDWCHNSYNFTTQWMQQIDILPETNSSPLKIWIVGEDEISFLVWRIFRGHVSCREGTIIFISNSPHLHRDISRLPFTSNHNSLVRPHFGSFSTCRWDMDKSPASEKNPGCLGWGLCYPCI